MKKPKPPPPSRISFFEFFLTIEMRKGRSLFLFFVFIGGWKFWFKKVKSERFFPTDGVAICNRGIVFLFLLFGEDHEKKPFFFLVFLLFKERNKRQSRERRELKRLLFLTPESLLTNKWFTFFPTDDEQFFVLMSRDQDAEFSFFLF